MEAYNTWRFTAVLKNIENFVLKVKNLKLKLTKEKVENVLLNEIFKSN